MHTMRTSIVMTEKASSDEGEDGQARFYRGFLHHKQGVSRASFVHDETDALP